MYTKIYRQLEMYRDCLSVVCVNSRILDKVFRNVQNRINANQSLLRTELEELRRMFLRRKINKNFINFYHRHKYKITNKKLEYLYKRISN